MSEVEVSVIVATYRREDALRRALESLLAQSFSSYEIIVVDDNDNDEWNSRVKTVVSSIQTKTTIAIYYLQNHPNKGSAETRNIGINAAHGKYITFLDDDDEYLPGKIQHQYDFMESCHADFSITDLLLYFENGVLCENRTREYIKKDDNESLLVYHLMHHMTGTDTMMFLKAYLFQIGCFDAIDIGDEYYLMLKAILGGGIFGYYHGCDVKAYVHTEQSGLSSGEGKIKGENALFENKKKYFANLTSKQINYITTRHYAVIAFAELRRKNLVGMVKNLFNAFFTSPIDCFRVIKEK